MHINGTYQVAGDAGFSRYRSEDISRAHSFFLSYVNKESYHSRFSSGIAKVFTLIGFVTKYIDIEPENIEIKIILKES